jgi:murein tripeptide amidase MpaA
MQHWFRVDTAYDDASGTLTIKHTPKHGCVRYAYFAPYSWERHTELVMRMQVG